ncbi:DUF3592 domain-containing protein [Bosea sp. (in: a-proteobacteria)]|uniref:DUF3592 domain-containing protein n=1 Tax=Bosea sp. (in: a-proteobacteria) TaxID=1871050 RepID=UPI002736527F|nr:DUF3592 domain-containing protein [Bosea sp. (in: a-proteobacteria)]MDP3409817.1 DUF3592 domain-containing protein [Bosea sp. (in: a-proteobacteria)]
MPSWFRGGLFLCVGVVLTLVSLIQLTSAWRLGRDGLRAQGEVIELNAGPAHPQVRFTTATGATVSYPQGGLVTQHVGDQVTVLYDSANPHDAVLDTVAARYGFAILDTVLALVFLGVSVVDLRRRLPLR